MAPSQEFRARLAQAENGDIREQGYVAYRYYQGDEGVNKDLALAFKYFRMAAEGGHAVSQVNLANLYVKGEGVEPDERMASAWYLRAAKEGGQVEAQYGTAVRFERGVGCDAPNIKEAIKWYQAAVVQGHAAAQLHLGFCYDEGNGVKKNPGLALKLWRNCAQHHELGDAKGYEASVAAAHNVIGSCYCEGTNGLEVDLPMAMQWWTKAAEQGDTAAQCTIGEIYLTGFLGERVPVGTFDRDVPRGMKYLRAVIAGAAVHKATAVKAKAEALIRDFHAAKSCMGCGTPKARKLCGGCVAAGQDKARYCRGEACHVMYWRHPTAPHKAECGSRAAARAGGSGAAACARNAERARFFSFR
jgi:TPR repeat protein